MENKDLKVAWHFKVQTDKHLQHNHLDIVIEHKKKRECQIIEYVACPGDSRVESKEEETRGSVIPSNVAKLI